MLISAPCVVSLTWRLQDSLGNLIDELAEPVEFFYGGEDLLETVEDALRDQEPGFATTVHLDPSQAFGDYDADLVFYEARSIFPENVEPGMQFDGPPPGASTEGLPKDAVYTVTEVYPEHVVLDGNHPLAGIGLKLDVTVLDVRGATDEEIETGSVGAPVFSVLNGVPPGGQLH